MKNQLFEKEKFIQEIKNNVKNLYRKTLEEASQQEVYQAVSNAVKNVVIDQWLATQKTFDKEDPKILYYMSMEFLMGRALGNNLINMTAYKEVKDALDEIGFDLNVIEDQEPDPALGNGGLGRLAAFFMESLDILLMAAASATAMDCSVRKLKMVFRWKCQITGLRMAILSNCAAQSIPSRLNLVVMFALRWMEEKLVLSMKDIRQSVPFLMICLCSVITIIW